MSNLGPQQQNASYDGVLQIPGGVTAQLQQVQDGEGRGTGLFLSSAGANVTTSDSFVASVNGTSLANTVPRLISDGFGDYVSVLDFGADPTGTADSTTALQNAVNAGVSTVYIPDGIYLFSTLTVPNNTRLVGAGARTAVLKHTGSGVAIDCVYTTPNPDGRGQYLDTGWFIFEDFELMANGTIGFDVSKTQSMFSTWNRVYMRHRRDLESGNPNAQYFPGSTAINCDNTPWTSSYATYLSKIHQSQMRGFETAVNLKATVNAWEIQHLYTLECKNHVVLDTATGIAILDCYFESNVAGALGVVFSSGGGNQVNIVGTGFELTNVAATQYAYSFSGSSWGTVSVIGAKYLIQGDGNALNSKRITGTPPVSFLEYNRTYTSPVYGEIPMLWCPQTSSAKPFQQPNFSRVGGYNQGNGQVNLGRSDTDAADCLVANDGSYTMAFRSYGSGFIWTDTAATPNTLLQFDPFGKFFAPGANAAQNLGTSSYRWANTYSSNYYLLDPNTSTVKQVVVGAADSGGTGYRLLRVAN